MLRSVSTTILLAVLATPAVAQNPEPDSVPRVRPIPRSIYRIPEMQFRLDRIPQMHVKVRPMPGFRTEAGGRMMLDRSWGRRMDVERRAMERIRDQMGRMKLMHPILHRRHFRDI